MSNFIHLHTHSDFSPQDGAQSTKQIANRAAELGMDSVALTDHGRCGGLLSFKKACVEAKVKPIYGLEAYVSPESRLIKEKVDGHKKTSYHLTLLAKNPEGLKNIFRLTSIGWKEGFYYKPRVDMEMLRKHSEGLVVLSGCGSGRLSQYLQEGKVSEVQQHVKEMIKVWGDDFYIEVQNHGLDWEPALKTLLFEVSDIYNVPAVATQDSHYQTRKDADLHRAICRLSAGDLTFDGDDSYFKSYEDMSVMFEANEQHALDRTQEVANKCNCEWEYGKTIWPVFELPAKITPEEGLRELTYAGYAEKFGAGTEEYKTRLEYELGIIEKMGFPTYFLVVIDFINWAKTNGIPVGPGRGSGAGSLVCYCIGITDIEPIKYGLYFERFLNPARVSLPDIDIDFCKTRREEVIQYITEKYGSDKVAQIGTYHFFKPRGSLRDFARVLGYPTNVGDELAKLVPPNVAGRMLTFDEVIESTPKILKTDYPDVIDMARSAEGLVSQAGIHASGIVISDRELQSQVPLFCGKGDEVTTQFDMLDVEEIGLVKYDILGLKNLTVIQETIEMVKKFHGVDINISKIDENDQEVFRSVFQKGRLDGVFQFETSSGFRDLCIKVKPESIEDLSTITALFRPGPLGTKDDEGKSMVDHYIIGRNGGEVYYPIKQLEPILKATYGVMVFQEQIMRICTDVAGYTLAEADNMRKIIGKKLPEKMKLEKEKFVNGCVANKIDPATAETLFKNIEGFAKYSFNKAHSVAYSVISYQTAWLKHYYPEEFYCALFNNSLKNQDDLVKYFHACRENDIPIQPPDVNTSSAQFVVRDKTIIFGLAGVKGLGQKVCETLINVRPENGFESIEHMISCGINLGAMKALAACGALGGITDIPRVILHYNIESIMKYYEKLTRWNERNQRIIEREAEIKAAHEAGQKPPRRLPKNSKPKPEAPEMKEVPEEERKDKLTFERETLGFYLTGHPMDSFPGLSRAARYTVQDLKEGKAYDNERIHVPVVISALNERRTRNGQNMAILTIEDKTGRLEATIFPRQWEKLKSSIKEDIVSIVDGTVRVVLVDDAPPMIRLVVNKVKEADEESQNKPVTFKLHDGSRVEFILEEDTNYSAYQQALAMVSNIQRME